MPSLMGNFLCHSFKYKDRAMDVKPYKADLAISLFTLDRKSFIITIFLRFKFIGDIGSTLEWLQKIIFEPFPSPSDADFQRVPVSICHSVPFNWQFLFILFRVYVNYFPFIFISVTCSVRWRTFASDFIRNFPMHLTTFSFELMKINTAYPQRISSYGRGLGSL